MIFAIIGKQRNGKTLLMNKLAKFFQKKGFMIVSNQKNLGYPHVYFNPLYLEDKKGIEELKKKLNTNKIILCLDEAHLWLDSRNSKKNTAKSFLITQSAKLMEEQGHFFFTSQFFGQVDIRLRYNTNFIFEVVKKKYGDEIYFEVTTYEPKGEKAFPIIKTRFSSKELFEDDLYDRFELVDVID